MASAVQRDAPALIALVDRLALQATLLFVVPIDPQTGREGLRAFLQSAASAAR